MLPDQTNNQIGQSVGAKLRAARVAGKLTQSQLASPDFSVSYISAIERGQIHPSLRALEILAARLGLSSTQLLPYRNNHEDAGGALTPQSSSHAEDEIDIIILESQIYIWQGDPGAASSLLKHQLQRNLARPLQVEVRFLLGWAYFRAGLLQESEQMLADAENMARDQNLPNLKARILYCQGNVYAAMRNYSHAIQTHQQCATLLEQDEPRDAFFISRVYTSLGQHYSNLNNSEIAIGMFQKAIQAVQEITNNEQLESSYWKTSQHYIESGDYQHGTLYAYKCMQIRILQSYRYLRSEIYHYLGRAELKGEASQIQAYLEKAQQDVKETHDQLAEASVISQLAEWHYMQNELDQADEAAHRANQLASNFGDTLTSADTYLVLGRICYARKDYTEGDENFIAGLRILEHLQASEEYADQAAQYAQLLEEQGKVYEALAYFRRAYESRQKIANQNHQ